MDLGHYRESLSRCSIMLMHPRETARDKGTKGESRTRSLPAKHLPRLPLHPQKRRAEKQRASAGMSVTPRDAVPFLHRVRGHFEICPAATSRPRRARLLTKGCARSLLFLPFPERRLLSTCSGRKKMSSACDGPVLPPSSPSLPGPGARSGSFVGIARRDPPRRKPRSRDRFPQSVFPDADAAATVYRNRARLLGCRRLFPRRAAVPRESHRDGETGRRTPA